ncbi:MAG: hypothetical protein JNK09_20445, partial [Prolixibacteraceae bacterium]|nr:hypothetical protein [Prolixibacteraceae bacterium]
ISIFLYSTVKAIRKDENQKLIDRHIILSGIALGNIVLIKMLFGYILVFMLFGVGLIWIINRTVIIYKRTFSILTVALIITMPYLFYTYSLTGRIFYWGMGSDTLYWMSSPHEGEYGDWKLGLEKNPIHMGNYNIPGADSILKAHHEQDLLHTEKFRGLEWDDEFRKLAINNIKEHPLKYAENVVYNIGRLIFHYPFSHAVQRPKILMIFPINGAILTLMIFSLIVTIINWRKIPFYMYFLLVFCFCYLGASALITTFVRMFTIIVPVLFIWIAFVLHNAVIVNWKFKQSQNEHCI